MQLQKLLEKYNVRGGIQNHSGNALEVNVSSTLRMIQDCDPEWIGVQYDPGHCTLSGEAPKLAVGLLGPYLHSVNLKSPRQEYLADKETGKLTYKNIWTLIRDGMLDAEQVLQALDDAGYTDPISIHAEYRTHYHVIEHDVPATTKIIGNDLAYMKQIIQSLNQKATKQATHSEKPVLAGVK